VVSGGEIWSFVVILFTAGGGGGMGRRGPKAAIRFVRKFVAELSACKMDANILVTDFSSLEGTAFCCVGFRLLCR
jgi:hypothetical protein